MSNFGIEFSNPWLLLLLIPALFLTLFPYFRLARKYRRTRNRIVSIVLHTLVLVLSITVLSGIAFVYDVPNDENELIILVDASFSGSTSEKEKNAFVKDIIDRSDESFRIGVVTFGYDQVYASELTRNTERVYDEYINAIRPDDSATDIASALNYARGLFSHPETAKIVLITDGIETDGKALNVIKSIAAEGIRVDTVFFPTVNNESEVQLIDVTTPDYNIGVGDEFAIGVTLQSSYMGSAYITLYDNDEPGAAMLVEFERGIQNVELKHIFKLPGMHKLYLEISTETDNLSENNSYYSYIYLQQFNHVLILERYDDESASLKALLDAGDYSTEVYSILTVEEDLGTDFDDPEARGVDALREFDQIILVNIANSDMPIGFDSALYSYVYDFGGGLLTVGGNERDTAGNVVYDGENPVAHAYSRSDMYGTLYQQMLPVQAIDYTPPVGVMIIIDRSGSMTGDDNGGLGTKLDLAKQGAISCLGALTERDYCGVMTLDDTYNETVALTPMPQRHLIEAAIDDIEGGGGTIFSGAIERAGSALVALNAVERKHIILVTDGEPADDFELYSSRINHYYVTAGITFSIVGIGVGSSAAENMRKAVLPVNGKFYDVWDVSTLPRIMREDLNLPEIKEVSYEAFTPRIAKHNAVTNGVTQEEMPQLFGFYGTKIKTATEENQLAAPLMGEYVPLYAHWKFGKGAVGSFMCDLNGFWSEEFLENFAGQRIVNNIVNNLFPTEDIHPKDIDIWLDEDNYNTQMNLTYNVKLEAGESVKVTINNIDSAELTEIEMSAENGYSRATFTVTQPGVYEIIVQKIGADGVTVLGEYSTYKTFSYSQEYNLFLDPEEALLFLSDIAKGGKGQLVDNAQQVFEQFVTHLHKVYDPRLAFIITALVLFLLDIAVRKFKFKWPHELVREYKEKKALKAQS